MIPIRYVTGDANYFTLSALLCLPVALYLLDNPRQARWERRFCIASIVVTMIAVGFFEPAADRTPIIVAGMN